MRKAATEAERVLWEALRDRRLHGLKFRRQHAVKPYILDFFCPGWGLGIEVDGGVHDWTAEEDAIRTAYLEGCGYHILRFRNQDVLHRLDAVLIRIIATIAAIRERRLAEVGWPTRASNE